MGIRQSVDLCKGMDGSQIRSMLAQLPQYIRAHGGNNCKYCVSNLRGTVLVHSHLNKIALGLHNMKDCYNMTLKLQTINVTCYLCSLYRKFIS